MSAVVLFYLSNSIEGESLDTTGEFDAARSAYDESAKKTAIEFEFVLNTASDQLVPNVTKHRPRVVHMSGHGAPGKGFILKGGKLLSVAQLSGIASAAANLGLRLMVLNYCQSMQAAKTLVDDEMAAIASAIGIDGEVPDPTAIKFASGFYNALGNGIPLGSAFQIACAHVNAQREGHSKFFRLFVKGVSDEDPEALRRAADALEIFADDSPMPSVREETLAFLERLPASPTVVLFHAPWSSASKVAVQKLGSLAKRIGKTAIMVRIDETDDNADLLIREHRLDAFPTYVVYRGGREVARYAGNDVDGLVEACKGLSS